MSSWRWRRTSGDALESTGNLLRLKSWGVIFVSQAEWMFKSLMGTKCQGQASFLQLYLPLCLFIVSYYLCIIQGKYQSFTLSLIHHLKHLLLVIEESESTQIPVFFFLVLFKWNVLTTIDPDSSKENSVQCFKLIQVILNGLTLPVGHGSGKKA